VDESDDDSEAKPRKQVKKANASDDSEPVISEGDLMLSSDSDAPDVIPRTAVQKKTDSSRPSGI